MDLSYTEELSKIRPLLLAFCKKTVFDKFHAEDIVQDTMLILVKKQDEYDPTKSFSGWAFRILNFQIRAYLSKSKRNKEDVFGFTGSALSNVGRENSKSIVDIDVFDVKSPRCSLIDKENHNDNKTTLEKIHNIIGDRSSKFLRLYLGGQSRAEIIDKLNMSIPSYYSTKRRLIKKVRTVMGCKA